MAAVSSCCEVSSEEKEDSYHTLLTFWILRDEQPEPQKLLQTDHDVYTHHPLYIHKQKHLILLIWKIKFTYVWH